MFACPAGTHLPGADRRWSLTGAEVTAPDLTSYGRPNRSGRRQQIGNRTLARPVLEDSDPSQVLASPERS